MLVVWCGRFAASAEVEELKAQVRSSASRPADREGAREPAHAQPGQAPATAAAVPSGTEPAITGEVAEVKDRKSLDNQQEAAPRPGDLTLDPKYRGFTRIPNTKVLIKFNAKPRVDMTIDPSNTGDDNRFVTAKIPVTGQPRGGARVQHQCEGVVAESTCARRIPGARASTTRTTRDRRGEFPYRIRHLGAVLQHHHRADVQHLRGSDVGPDTVDYEGPNSAVFARRPLVRYLLPLTRSGSSTRPEQPESEVDLTGQPEGARASTMRRTAA